MSVVEDVPLYAGSPKFLTSGFHHCFLGLDKNLLVNSNTDTVLIWDKYLKSFLPLQEGNENGKENSLKGQSWSVHFAERKVLRGTGMGIIARGHFDELDIRASFDKEM